MAVLPGKNITILLRGITEDKQNILDVIQLELETGKTRYAAFNSYANFNGPDILFNGADSSTTVYAQMGRTYKSGKTFRNIFFARLDDTLNIKAKPAVAEVTI